jgi:hypothetical protein
MSSTTDGEDHRSLEKSNFPELRQQLKGMFSSEAATAPRQAHHIGIRYPSLRRQSQGNPHETEDWQIPQYHQPKSSTTRSMRATDEKRTRIAESHRFESLRQSAAATRSSGMWMDETTSGQSQLRWNGRKRLSTSQTGGCLRNSSLEAAILQPRMESGSSFEAKS